MNCPLERTATATDPVERSGRHSPGSAAVCYQLHDTLKLAYGMSLQPIIRETFRRQIALLKSQIEAYEKLQGVKYKNLTD